MTLVILNWCENGRIPDPPAAPKAIDHRDLPVHHDCLSERILHDVIVFFSDLLATRQPALLPDFHDGVRLLREKFGIAPPRPPRRN